MSENQRRPVRMHGPGARMGGEKAKDFKGTIKKLVKYMGSYWPAFVAVLFFAIGSTVFGIIGPKISGKATTELFNGLVAKVSGTGSINFEKIGQILLLLLGLYVLSAVLSFIQGLIMTGISQKLAYRFREEICSKINRMPMKYFESRTVGEVLSRITNDVDTLGQSLNQSVTQLITSLTTMVGVLIMMLSISPLMTLIAIVILPISAGLIGLVVKKSQKFFVAQQKYLGEINGQVEEVYSGHNIVKAYNKEEDVEQTFHDTNNILYQSAWKSQFLSGLMQPIMTFVGNLGYVSVAVVGSMLAVRGTITVGDIQAFIQYVRNFTQPITQLAQVSNMLQSTAAAAERVFEFLEEEEEVQNVENPVHLEFPQGRVDFQNVVFGYNPDKIIIHNFNCSVKPGQTVAIVGPTGAGKTTMVKLLMRFYDGRLDATDEEVIQAAKAAHAHHFIQTLPGGYQMELNEDASNVSQGQKQLLTIARAILADNKIMILDEATSSVDTRTEQQIQKAMNHLMEGRTSFVIAHRLSTIRDADLILVMKDGDIIEQGKHEELLAKNGFYAELYNSQFVDATA